MRTFLSILLASTALLAQGTAWEHDFQAALKRAKAEKKPVFMDLYTEWCPPCQRLKAEIFPQAEAEKALKNFVPLAVLVEKGTKKDRTPIPEGKKVAADYKLEVYPTLIILDENGKEIRRHRGTFFKVEEFVAWLNEK